MNASKLLGDALVDLMQTTPIDKLSVEQICAHAEVSKQTFYRYYTDKYALLEECFEKRVLQSFEDVAGRLEWETGLVQHFDRMREQMVFVRNGYLSKDVNGLFQCDVRLTTMTIERLLTEQGVDIRDPLIHFAVEKEVKGSVHLVKEWVLGGMRMSDEEMAHFISVTMPEVLKPYLIPENYASDKGGCEAGADA